MSTKASQQPTQSIGRTILVVMMDVDPEHDEEFNGWYNDELPNEADLSPAARTFDGLSR